ncbi:distal tail protein Dit [Peribacillus glennii]|uniref:Siphovirus-type tail component RIFT-related domain-containing protein n=1 Tax=Peribacillus glennii TaxID=2303991 RepID=A0A372L7F7_9BACI|nr:distal tail protein Dit [Peribacillus glennii]RFU61206.1 hypothetical protein D0466_18470 [Peribacillus glennii]
MNSMTYIGTSFKSLGIHVNKVNVPLAPAISSVTTDIPGRRGVLFFGNNIGERTITIDITLLCGRQREQNDKKRLLANMTIHQNAFEGELYFDQEPEWVYYGYFSGVGEWVELTGYDLQTSLTFTCSDPLRYGDHITVPITGTRIEFTPKGEQTIFPVIRGIATKDNTMVAVTTRDRYVYVGGELDADSGEAPLKEYETVLHDPATDIALWERVSNETTKSE